MMKQFVALMEDESGLILSAELVLILTILVLGVIVGLVQLQTAVVSELNDLSMAFSRMNQSYATAAFFGCPKWWGVTSFTAGSGFIDVFDGCIGVGGWSGGGYADFGYCGEPGRITTSGTAIEDCAVPSTAVAPPVMPCETCIPGQTYPAAPQPTPDHSNHRAAPQIPAPAPPRSPD